MGLFLLDKSQLLNSFCLEHSTAAKFVLAQQILRHVGADGILTSLLAAFAAVSLHLLIQVSVSLALSA